jgi:hypothetical protein
VACEAPSSFPFLFVNSCCFSLLVSKLSADKDSFASVRTLIYDRGWPTISAKVYAGVDYFRVAIDVIDYDLYQLIEWSGLGS